MHQASLDSDDDDCDDVTTAAPVSGKRGPLQCDFYESGMQTREDPVRLTPRV